MRKNSRIKLSLVLATALAAGSVATAATAAEAPAWRDLTPWFVDAIKIERGLQPELDWNSEGAPEYQDVMDAINARPVLSGPEEVYDTEHFRIHYTYEGRDAATDEQVLWSADALEFTWSREIEQMGYPEPPSDGFSGGDERYDVYWTKQVGTYGYCAAENMVDENSMTSYLALATWMNQVETQVTVAHEFFHALHFTMDALEETWWFEVTATWMEDYVYDDINDYYYYIGDVFQNPEVPVNSDTTIMYGYAIFAHSLSEAFGPQIIQDIWFDTSDTIQPEALETTEAVVNRYGDWNESIHNFRESLFDITRFSEGEDYAMAIGSDGEPGEVSFTQSITDYPAEDSGNIDQTGTNLIEFVASGSEEGTLTIDYSGGTDLVASVLVEDSSGEISEYYTDTELGAGGSFTLHQFGTTRTRAVMVVTNTGLKARSSFSYTASVPEWEGGQGCSMVGASDRTHRSAAPLMALILAFGGMVLARRKE